MRSGKFTLTMVKAHFCSGGLGSEWDRLGPETWDLGPFAAVLAPGQNIFSSNKIQRSYKGLKITAYMGSWVNYEQDTRRAKANCHFWGVGRKSRVLPVCPAQCTTKAVAGHPSHPRAQALDPSLPSSHVRNQLAPLREQTREPITCFGPLKLQHKSK